jgi:hypothetical protein
VRLERVDLDRADVVQVVEDVDVRIPVGVGDGRVEEVPAFGVVGGHRTHERELDLRHLLFDDPIGIDHTQRILPRIESGHLAQQRAIDVDAELIADVDRVLGRERHVLGSQWIDRGWDDVSAAVHALGYVLRHVEHGCGIRLEMGQ